MYLSYSPRVPETRTCSDAVLRLCARIVGLALFSALLLLLSVHAMRSASIIMSSTSNADSSDSISSSRSPRISSSNTVSFCDVLRSSFESMSFKNTGIENLQQQWMVTEEGRREGSELAEDFGTRSNFKKKKTGPIKFQMEMTEFISLPRQPPPM